MTTTHPETGNPGAVGAYLVALLVVGGAVAAVVTMGLGGLILWFVGLTFVILAAMIVVSLP